jgi:hypothetical protein
LRWRLPEQYEFPDIPSVFPVPKDSIAFFLLGLSAPIALDQPSKVVGSAIFAASNCLLATFVDLAFLGFSYG